MKRTNKKKLNLNEPSFDLNKFSTGCAPCLSEALKIGKLVNNRSLNEIKINEIKKIVNSIFDSSKNGTQ
tara:strand:- start:265 stop:471 length:207 start_codon:yes stop_codon:yes gene_type:complete